MTATVHFNKEFVDASGASLSIHDGGWLHGAGLFETMRAENGRVFRLESHIQRLQRSAETILVPIERDALPTTDDVSGLLTRNGLTKARLRLTVSAGKSTLSTGKPALSAGSENSEFRIQNSQFVVAAHDRGCLEWGGPPWEARLFSGSRWTDYERRPCG